MNKVSLTLTVFLLSGLMQLSAQDNKNESSNKNDKSVLEEHKNGGKKDENGNKERKPENKDEKKSEKPATQPAEKKQVPKYDKKPH